MASFTSLYCHSEAYAKSSRGERVPRASTPARQQGLAKEGTKLTRESNGAGNLELERPFIGAAAEE